MKNVVLILIVLILLLGCENTTPSSSDSVYALVDGDILGIVNPTDMDVYYFVIESNQAAFTDWAPICTDSNIINPRSMKSIRYSDSTFLPSKQAIVYWWFKGAKYNSGEYYGADYLRSFTVAVK